MIALRPNKFTQPDYSVIYKDTDGRELSVGRIFYTETALAKSEGCWFWSVEFHQRRGRVGPYQGHEASREIAMTAWRRCWDSADEPVRWPPGAR